MMNLEEKIMIKVDRERVISNVSRVNKKGITGIDDILSFEIFRDDCDLYGTSHIFVLNMIISCLKSHTSNKHKKLIIGKCNKLRKSNL